MKIPMRQVALVCGSFVYHMIFMGIPLSFGVMYSELLAAYDIGEGELGWVASVYTGFFLGTSIVSGVIISAVGTCKTGIVGSLLMAVGMVSSAFVTSPYLLYVTYGITAGLGASMIGMVAYVMIIDEEITSRRSVLVGVASSGGGIGTIFLPPLTSWIIDMYGWRGCFILMGGLCLQGLVVSALIYSRNTSIKSDSKTEEGNRTETPFSQKCREQFAFFNGIYFCYLVATILAFIAFFVPFNLIYNMMLTRGQTKEHSSLTLSLSGFGSITSRFVIGFLGDYKCFHRIYYYIFSLLFAGAITVACVHFTVFWQFLVYGFLYGFGLGIFSFMMAVLVADLVGADNMATAFGLALTASGIGTGVGTPAGGWIADATGNYNGSFYFCGAFFISGGLVASLIPAFWHCKPFKQRVIMELELNPDEIEASCPQVEIYRIQDHTTEYKTEFDVNEHNEVEASCPQVKIYRIQDHITEYKTGN